MQDKGPNRKYQSFSGKTTITGEIKITNRMAL